MPNNIHELLSSASDKDIKRRCIGGLIAYAAQCERDNPGSAEVPEIRELVGRIASFWGLDGLSDETLQTDFLRPFDLMTGAVSAGVELTDGFYNQRIAAVYGLVYYSSDLADTHGIDALGEIMAMRDLTMEIAAAWQLDTEDFGPLDLDAMTYRGERQREKLKDLLNTPLDANTYLVNAELADGWMPVGGLCLSMLPEDFQTEWADILESPVMRIIEDGAYGKEIFVYVDDGQRLQDFPFALLPIYKLAQEQEQAQTGESLPASRKAELFDMLMQTTHENDPCDNWYGLLHEIGMDEDEMRAAGLDLPELKVTPEAVKDTVDHIIAEIMKTHMEGHQIYIDFSVSDLVTKCGFDPESCSLASDMFYEELSSREEIATAEIRLDKLIVRPEAGIIDQLHKLDPPGLTMQ